MSNSATFQSDSLKTCKMNEKKKKKKKKKKNTENIRISQTFRSSLTVLHLSLIFGFEMSASLRFFNF